MTGTPAPTDRPARRRLPLTGAVVATVLLGLASTRLTGPDGSATDTTGDLAGGVLYAVLVVLLLALVAPRARTRTLVAVGWVVCAAVELAQLTGLAAAVGEVLPAARLVLGSTFVATDLLAYAVGCVLAGALDTRLPRATAAPVEAVTARG